MLQHVLQHLLQHLSPIVALVAVAITFVVLGVVPNLPRWRHKGAKPAQCCKKCAFLVGLVPFLGGNLVLVLWAIGWARLGASALQRLPASPKSKLWSYYEKLP